VVASQPLAGTLTAWRSRRATPDKHARRLAGAHFGEKKLATFLAATAWPTISVAALELGIQPGSLQPAIRNFDRVLGERGLAERGTSRPLQLTRIGSCLLTQARQHEP
jgi:hypothetical protein